MHLGLFGVLGSFLDCPKPGPKLSQAPNTLKSTASRKNDDDDIDDDDDDDDDHLSDHMLPESSNRSCSS